MKVLSWISMLILCTVIFSNCHEDEVEETEEVIPPDPTISEVHDVSGVITDQSGTPLAGVSVSFASKTVITNVLGQFRIIDIPLSDQGGCLSTSLSGYADACHMIYTNSSLQINKELFMIPVADPIVVDNTTATEVALPDGSYLHLDANAFETTGGSGVSEVHITFADAHTDDTQAIPAQLAPLYNDTDGATKIVSSKNIKFLQFQNASGQLLSIKESAEVTMKVPKIQTHQTEVEHLVFDHQAESWKLGSGVVEEDSKWKYRITSSGWQKVGVISEVTFVDFLFTLSNGTPSDRAVFWIEQVEDLSLVHYGILEYDIRMCLPIPVDQAIRTVVYDACGAKRMNETAQFAFSEIKQEQIYNLDMSNPVYQISGDIIGCNNQPYTSPIRLTIETGSREPLVTDVTGSFSITVTECVNIDRAEIVFYDPANGLLERIPFTEFSDATVQQVVTFCKDQNTINTLFEFDNDVYEDTRALSNKEETLILAERVLLGFDGYEVGTFPARLIYATGGEGTVTITKYGNVGETIEGTYAVQMIGSDRVNMGRFVAERIK